MTEPIGSKLFEQLTEKSTMFLRMKSNSLKFKMLLEKLVGAHELINHAKSSIVFNIFAIIMHLIEKIFVLHEITVLFNKMKFKIVA